MLKFGELEKDPKYPRIKSNILLYSRRIILHTVIVNIINSSFVIKMMIILKQVAVQKVVTNNI